MGSTWPYVYDSLHCDSLKRLYSPWACPFFPQVSANLLNIIKCLQCGLLIHKPPYGDNSNGGFINQTSTLNLQSRFGLSY